MKAWEEARISRLEDRIERIERKEWERRDLVFRMIVHGLTAAVAILTIVSVVLSIVHAP